MRSACVRQPVAGQTTKGVFMRKLFIVTAAAAAFVAVPAMAQDYGTTESAPDSSVSRVEPYVGVMGGWEQFDNERNAGIPQSPNRNDRLKGWLVHALFGFGMLRSGIEHKEIRLWVSYQPPPCW